MRDDSVLLVGGPDSGKTNYLAMLWEALLKGGGCVRAGEAPTSIGYVEDALNHLHKGRFAPRTEVGQQEGGLTINVQGLHHPARQSGAEIVVPDVSGELWSGAIRNYQLPREWLVRLGQASGALLFVRVDSDQNVDSLNWVTARELLKWIVEKGEEEPEWRLRVPTDVQLCELLRLMESRLGTETDVVRPRVGLMITAWDILDGGAAGGGPIAFLKKQYPLLAGRVVDLSRVEVGVFGVSVVGGDLRDPSFRNRFLSGEPDAGGYLVRGGDEEAVRMPDLTLPIGWVLDADRNG